jgi:hypothetical protein
LGSGRGLVVGQVQLQAERHSYYRFWFWFRFRIGDSIVVGFWFGSFRFDVGHHPISIFKALCKARFEFGFGSGRDLVWFRSGSGRGLVEVQVQVEVPRSGQILVLVVDSWSFLSRSGSVQVEIRSRSVGYYNAFPGRGWLMSCRRSGAVVVLLFGFDRIELEV